MKKICLASALLCLAPMTVWAESDFVEGEATFAGEAELGATLTTGNTDTSSLKARLALKHELGQWENQYLFEGLYKEDTDEVTAKRYYLGAQGNYQLNEQQYLFVNINDEVDPFTGFDYKLNGSIGYGYKFINDETTLFTAEIGPGYTYRRLDSEQAALKGYESEDSFVVHGLVRFEHKISDNAQFSQLLIADYGEHFEGRSESALTANIIGALAMKLAVIVRFNDSPLDDKKATDTETNMTLLYSF